MSDAFAVVITGSVFTTATTLLVLYTRRHWRLADMRRDDEADCERLRAAYRRLYDHYARLFGLLQQAGKPDVDQSTYRILIAVLLSETKIPDELAMLERRESDHKPIADE